MHQVTLDMQMSSEAALATVVTALTAMPAVTIRWETERHLFLTISTDDPDDVEIVREITWELDPCAVQLSLHLDAAS